MESTSMVSCAIEQFYTPMTVTIYKSCSGGEYYVRYRVLPGLIFIIFSCAVLTFQNIAMADRIILLDF